MKLKIRYFYTKIALLFLVNTSVLNAQQTVQHHVDFESGMQNMWGPSFSAFSIDTVITFFDESWNIPFNSGNGITTILGQQFGAQTTGHFSGRIGSQFSLEGFTTGTVEVDYPIDITLDMPTDSTYDQGDEVVIETNYIVNDSNELITNYPTAGEASLDFFFEMGAELTVEVCVFGCATIPIIPSFNTGLVNINIFTANANGVWYLGPGDPVAPWEEGIKGFPYALAPQTSPTTNPPNFIPWQCHVPFFPADIDGGSTGISGKITIPYVETEDNLSGNSITACGDSTYFNLNLEIFKLISNFVPDPVIKNVLANLSGEYEIAAGPISASVNWNLFSASFDANITNKQCFDFSPKVYGRYEFPVAVEYAILDGSTGAILNSGNSSIINIQIGNSIRYKFPCYFEDLDIVSTYSIDGTFTNHTFDSVSFDFLMSAFEFGLSLPEFTIIPSFTIDPICVNIPYPCPTWSDPFRWCSERVCTPEITFPAVVFPGLEWGFGPLWETSIPIGSFEYDWFKQTWSLEGFSDTTFVPFRMTANLLGISSTKTDIDCYGGNTGAIDVTTAAISPAFPYTYEWTNGETTEDLTNLVAGDYELSVIDNNGCQMFTGQTINQPVQPLQISFSKTDKNCNGGIDDGTIDLTVIGGTAPYNYSWNNGLTSSSINGLSAGIYTVTVTDANNCSEILSINIAEPSVLSQTAAITDVNCFGGNDGAINSFTFGGALPYMYSWSSGQNSENILGLTAGTYTLTITDGNGCINTTNYNVNEPVAPITLSTSETPVDCNGNSTGSINLTVNGGTPGYAFQWINSIGEILPQTSEDIIGMPTDNYTVVVTDANGCVESISQQISEPDVVSEAAVITNVNCFGESTGGIVSNISGGTTPYSYNWSSGQTSTDLVNVPSGDYALTVTDANGCVYPFNFTITQPDAPLSINLIGTDILCHGESTGRIEATVSGGTEPYTFNWSSGQTTEDISNLVAGTHTLTVTDQLGCTETATQTLNQPVAPIALSTVVTDVDCHGNNTGAIDLTVTGGTTPYSYQWLNDQYLILTETSEDISNQYANGYSVIVTDANGCVDTIQSTINQPVAPLEMTSIIDDVNCHGVAEGSIDATITGGTLPYTYSWSNGATTEDISMVLAGDYTLTVTDANGCQITATWNIDQPVSPLAVVLTVDDVKCNGDDTGRIDSEVQGGTAPYIYNWSNGQDSTFIQNLSAGAYTLEVTDAQGCQFFTGANVGEPNALVVTPTVTDPSCFGYSDGQIVIAINGGMQPYYFNWGNQNEILLNNPSETIDSIKVGNYFVRVRDRNGCINEQIVTVNEPDTISVEAIISDALCFEEASGSIDLSVIGGTQPYTYNWSNGANSEDINGLLADRYSVIVEDAQGCTYESTYTVDQPNQITVSSQIIETTCIDQTDAEILITPYGGTPSYTFDWNTQSSDQNVLGLAPGIYDVTVTDQNGCSENFGFEIIGNNDECVKVPTAFSPNDDNYNDTWVLENLDLYPKATVKIFNKWGDEIYSSEGEYQEWNGTHNGNKLPSEVYFYIIELNNEEENKYSGTVTIIY